MLLLWYGLWGYPMKYYRLKDAETIYPHPEDRQREEDEEALILWAWTGNSYKIS